MAKRAEDTPPAEAPPTPPAPPAQPAKAEAPKPKKPPAWVLPGEEPPGTASLKKRAESGEKLTVKELAIATGNMAYRLVRFSLSGEHGKKKLMPSPAHAGAATCHGWNLPDHAVEGQEMRLSLQDYLAAVDLSANKLTAHPPALSPYHPSNPSHPSRRTRA